MSLTLKIRLKPSAFRVAAAGAITATAIIAAFAASCFLRPAFYRAPGIETQAMEKQGTPPGMVYVPGGFFLAGTGDQDAEEDQKPQRRAFVASFYMDRTEVTNRQFRQFHPGHAYLPGEDTLPVTNVTYDEAAAYARWAGKRLPTELEWEKAARGVDGRRYPWGNVWNPARIAARRSRPRSGNDGKTAAPPLPPAKTPNACLLTPSRLRAVGSLPAGASPYGCLDMAGNAWEWVQGFYQGNPQQRILRGGAVGYGERACRTYYRAIEGASVT